jgi:hypothetical protein
MVVRKDDATGAPAVRKPSENRRNAPPYPNPKQPQGLAFLLEECMCAFMHVMHYM